MSYILDALRKSEQQRRLGATPTLHMGAAAPGETVAARRRWWPPALAVALTGVAFAAGWLQPWRDAPVAAPVASPVATEPSPPVAAPSPSPAPPVAAPTPPQPQDDTQRLAVAPERSTGPAAAQPERNMTAQAQAQREAPKARPAEPPARRSTEFSQPEPAAKVQRKGEEKILTLAELPAELRAELPAMTVTVHSFTPTPAQRLVGVNNRYLREGDPLTPDLVLEKITPDGMVFNYRGTRFHRGLR